MINVTFTTVSAYTGDMPDKANQTKEVFANNIAPYLDFFNSSFIGSLTTFTTELSDFKTQLNDTETAINSKEASATASAATADTAKDVALATANATVWTAGSYDYPTVKIDDNGYSYRCLGTNVTTQPKLDSANWLNLSKPLQTKEFIAYEDILQSDFLGVTNDGKAGKLTTIESYTSISTQVGNGVNDSSSEVALSKHMEGNFYVTAIGEDDVGINIQISESDSSGFTAYDKTVVFSASGTNGKINLIKLSDTRVFLSYSRNITDSYLKVYDVDTTLKTLTEVGSVTLSGAIYRFASFVDENCVIFSYAEGGTRKAGSYKIESNGSIALAGTFSPSGYNENFHAVKYSDTELIIYHRNTADQYEYYQLATFNNTTKVVTQGSYLKTINNYYENVHSYALLTPIIDLGAGRYLKFYGDSNGYTRCRIDTYDGITFTVGGGIIIDTMNSGLAISAFLLNSDTVMFAKPRVTSTKGWDIFELDVAGNSPSLNNITEIKNTTGNANLQNYLCNIAWNGDSVFTLSYPDVLQGYIKEFHVNTSTKVITDNILSITSENPFIGFAESDVLQGETFPVKLKNIYQGGYSGLTIGAVYYYDNILQGITLTVTDKRVGVAISANELMVSEV